MWCGDVTKVVEMLDTAMMGDICDDTFWRKMENAALKNKASIAYLLLQKEAGVEKQYDVYSWTTLHFHQRETENYSGTGNFTSI